MWTIIKIGMKAFEDDLENMKNITRGKYFSGIWISALERRMYKGCTIKWFGPILLFNHPAYFLGPVGAKWIGFKKKARRVR